MEEKDRNYLARIADKQTLKGDYIIKTQNQARTQSWCANSPVHLGGHIFDGSWHLSFHRILKSYRENRENGDLGDNPNPFPSSGFENLDVKSSGAQSGKWPDPQRRYWWQIILHDGQVVKDFYWTTDKQRGYPEKNSSRYWYSVHHAPSGTTIDGFSDEPDYQKGFPDKNRRYWRYLQYTECGPIKEWMEEKDRKYGERLKHEKELKQGREAYEKKLAQPVVVVGVGPSETKPNFSVSTSSSVPMQPTPDEALKTQNYGVSPLSLFISNLPPWYPSYLDDLVARHRHFAHLFSGALRNYRENRENGTEQDDPNFLFPSAGWDALAIVSSSLKNANDWPDRQGRYWWKLTLDAGRGVEDFYWTKDEVRGWPDKSKDTRYWFIVHHKSGTKIEGFSQEPDHERGFPDKSGSYWYAIRFIDTHCPAIRQWMEEKDRNYLARLERERGQRPDKKDEPGPSSSQDVTLLRAIREKDIACLERLSQSNRTNWQEMDDNGNNAFHIAAKGMSKKVLRAVIVYIPKNIQTDLLVYQNDDSDTPLHIAVRMQNIDMVKMLINALGAYLKTSLQTMNKRGYLPLHEAAERGLKEIALELIKAGAKRDAKTRGGKTAQQLAEANGHAAWLKDSAEGRPDSGDDEEIRSEPNSRKGKSKLGESEAKAREVRVSSCPQERTEPAPEQRSQEGIRVVHEVKVFTKEELNKKEPAIARGGFSWVYRGYYAPQRLEIAIKELLCQQLTQEAQNEFKQETKMLTQLQHCHYVVNLHGICLSPYAIVQEYMAKGSLHQVLHSQENLSWALRIRMALDIGCGLAYLHEKHIVHRDLKSRNVLVNEQYRAKLGDFGLAKVRKESHAVSHRRAGTTAWMAPELLSRKRGEPLRYSNKSDVYSYGMVLWELSSREEPFKDAENDSEMARWVLDDKENEKEKIPEATPLRLSYWIKQCWFNEPNKRPEVKEITEDKDLRAQEVVIQGEKASSSSQGGSASSSSSSDSGDGHDYRGWSKQS